MATAECRAIQRKQSLIVERLSTASNLTWFSGKLRENDFIDSRKTASVTSMKGASADEKISQLLDAVETKIKHSEEPHKLFEQFVTIFECEPSLKDVSQILYKTRQELKDHAASYPLPENDSSVGEDSTNDPARSRPMIKNSSATWSTTPVQAADDNSFSVASIPPEKNEGIAELESADGEGRADRVVTNMSVPRHENGTTMRSSVMVYGSTMPETPTPQRDPSVEDLLFPIRHKIQQAEDRLLEKDEQIDTLKAEIAALKSRVATLAQEKDSITAELMSVKSSYESTLKQKEVELAQYKKRLSLKERENDRMREEFNAALQKAQLEEKERIKEYEAAIQNLHDQKVKAVEKQCELICEKSTLYCESKDKIHELELKLKDKDIELEKSKREVAEKESQVRILQAQDSYRECVTLRKNSEELERRLSEQESEVLPYPPRCVLL